MRKKGKYFEMSAGKLMKHTEVQVRIVVGSLGGLVLANSIRSLTGKPAGVRKKREPITGNSGKKEEEGCFAAERGTQH